MRLFDSNVKLVTRKILKYYRHFYKGVRVISKHLSKGVKTTSCSEFCCGTLVQIMIHHQLNFTDIYISNNAF